MLDDTLINGRPMHEWVRHCLLLAADGATLDALCACCTANGIPPRRKDVWSPNTWFYMLTPTALLKYCGIDVWNVHRKNGTVRPAEEWTIVENAHPAIITPDEAQQVAHCRHAAAARPRFDWKNPCKDSPYLLSGGLLKCGCCGSNLVSHTSGTRAYYVCGSHYYRHGEGCIPHGIYLPKDWLETAIVELVRAHLLLLAELPGEMASLNLACAALEHSNANTDSNAAEERREIDEQITRLRQAIMQGFDDVAWANAQLQELRARQHALTPSAAGYQAPRFSSDAARTWHYRLDKLAAMHDISDLRGLLRQLLDAIVLDPTALTLELHYAYPGPLAIADGRRGQHEGMMQPAASLAHWFSETLPIQKGQGRHAGNRRYHG